MAADVLDLEGERLDRTCGEMDDETLVFCMVGLLKMDDLSGTAGKCARTVFLEIVKRWVPIDAFASAFLRLEEGEDAR